MRDRGYLYKKTYTGASFIPGSIFDFVSRLHDDLYMSFHISLFVGTLRVDKIHMIQNRKHYACATRSSLPADRFHTDTSGRFAFTWHRWRFRTEVKISPRHNNRGELTPGWLAPAWHFVVVSWKQVKSHEREPERTHAGAKSPQCHVNPPIGFHRLCSQK